ncbi:MAG TPA: hypothetical protein VJ302_28410, partial [Blastocatellia bacterium]|nr:hypothetical protein [Blastocatellia bacterium]
MKAKETLFLSPASEDFTAFADFLKQPGTGLLRLMPRESFDHVLSIRGGGAYYSFVTQSHPYGFGSDLSLELQNFKVGFAGADFGFLVSLGNPPVESVGLETPGVASLASFSPPLDEPGAREQQRRASEGFLDGGFLYKDRLPVSIGTTFTLRSISYRCNDVLVVFRVYRQDVDGSLIIPWKMLKRYATPQLNGETFAVTSAASYEPSNFAPGMIAAAFGRNLADRDYFATELPLPTQLGGVSVAVQDSNEERTFQITAQLFAVTPTQVNFLIPPEVVEGYALITVFLPSNRRLTELVRITKVAPGIFTANANGQGVPSAVALRVINEQQTYEPVSRFDAAQNKFVPVPIDLGDASNQVFLILFGTGIHGRSALDQVSVKIGGIEAPVRFAGPQGMPGLDQLNVELPRGLAGLGEVEVIVTVDGQIANVTKIEVR